MHPDNDKFTNAVLFTNKLIVKFLICILTICLISATVHLVAIIYYKLVRPPFLIIDVTTLFDVFSLILIITIGYELVKSLLIVISSQSIPSFPIIQIAIIAVANKIITLDIAHTDFKILLGLASLLVGLGVAYFFHKTKNQDQELEK